LQTSRFFESKKSRLQCAIYAYKKSLHLDIVPDDTIALNL